MNPHPGLKLNPDYPIYCCRYNAMYHDYDMTAAEIVSRIGQEPPKYIVDEEMLLEMARADAIYKAILVEIGRMQKALSTKLRHENMDAPSNDDLMETADNWYELEQDLEAAELSDLDETYAAASNRYGY